MSPGKPIPNPEKSFDTELPFFDLPDREQALATTSDGNQSQGRIQL